MKLKNPKVKVSVPATSANLGPGFDVLGLAFQMYNNFIFQEATSNTFIGCDPKYQNTENAVYKAAQHLFRQYANDPSFEQPLSITFDAAIPTGRGLGSSAACIAGGLMGANLMLGSPYSKEEIFQMASILEGHPDNVAAAIYGGVTIASRTDGMYYCKSVPVSKELSFFLVIPDFEISTQQARTVLKDRVTLGQASLNIANSAMLVLALMEGDASLLEIAGTDYLYEEQRKTLIPLFDEIKKLALDLGASHCCISGSGPTLLFISAKSRFKTDLFNSGLKTLKAFPAFKFFQVQPDTNGAVCQII